MIGHVWPSVVHSMNIHNDVRITGETFGTRWKKEEEQILVKLLHDESSFLLPSWKAKKS